MASMYSNAHLFYKGYDCTVRFIAPIFFSLMLPYCVNLKAIRYESTSLIRIVADKSHRVYVAK